MYLQFEDIEELKKDLQENEQRYFDNMHVLVGFEFYVLEKTEDNWMLTSFQSIRGG